LNFNISLLFILFLLAACGLKGDPVNPKSSVLPSLFDKNYPDIELNDPLSV